MKITGLAAWARAVVRAAAGFTFALAAAGIFAAPPDSPWGANYFPNVELVNHDGRTLRFYDDMIKDKVVMINFMYATCHDACPLETAKLRQVQEALGTRVGREIFIYSISIDPDHDSPAVLREYAQKFKVGPGWQFLTGRLEDIELLRRKLGLYEDGEPRSDHTMNLIVGNEATGQWKQRSSFDNPKVLARVVGDELFNYSRPRANDASYAEAPRLIALDPGEDLFRRRCQVCHTVGAGDTLGPDLAGVTRARPRAWLVRWLKAPDEMLAARDATALALYAKYKELPMPNLRLSDHDVDVLMGYLETQTERVEGMQAARARQEAMRHDHAGHDHTQHHH